MISFRQVASVFLSARRILLAGAGAGLLVAGFAGVPLASAGDRPDSFADLAASVSDAVVNISATQTYEEKDSASGPDVDPGTPFDDLFYEFLRRHQQGGDGDAGHPHMRSS
ncbi:MAG: serine protease, partial [Methylovirgula sp.]|nr:serine protease [Methylovirgula sp.]